MIDKYFLNATGSIGEKILKFTLRLVFLGGFDGAWYLVTTIISVLILYWLSHKLNNTQIFLISLLLYFFAVLSGTYLNLFNGTFLYKAFTFFNIQCGVPLYRTFCHGLIFMLIGKIFAENGQLLTKKITISLIIILPFFMYAELLLTNYFGLNYSTDCFFMLVPFSIVLFQFALYYNPKPKSIYILFRNSSTFIYMFHFIFLYILYRFANMFKWTIFFKNILVIIAVYVATIIISVLLCMCIKKLSKKIKFLKYAL